MHYHYNYNYLILLETNTDRAIANLASELRAVKKAVQKLTPGAVEDTFVRESQLSEIKGINKVLGRQESRLEAMEEESGPTIDLHELTDWPIKTPEAMDELIHKVQNDKNFKSSLIRF